VSEVTKRNVRETKIAKEQIFPPDNPHYEKFKKYRRKVHYWTEKNDLSQLDHFEKRSRTRYRLNHKFSVAEEFKNNILPRVIATLGNLHFFPYTENSSKGTTCLISKEELYELFEGRN
jgi:hypothetical protein